MKDWLTDYIEVVFKNKTNDFKIGYRDGFTEINYRKLDNINKEEYNKGLAEGKNAFCRGMRG